MTNGNNNVNTKPIVYEVRCVDDPDFKRLVEASSAYQARRIFAEQHGTSIANTAAEIAK